MSHATTNYISFLNCLYSVEFLCQLLFDINWFILEYIINCTGKGLQVLIRLIKLLAFIFLSLFIVYVLLKRIFLSTILVNKNEYIYLNVLTGLRHSKVSRQKLF